MENNKSYFGEIGAALKTLGTGLKVTMKEYFTPKTTEQYPENRKTTLHVSKRHRGRLVFKRNEDESYKCVACLMCEKACPGSLPGLIDGGAPLTIGKFNTKTK